MGVELHITRTPESGESDVSITAQEWLAYVASDPELRLGPENGPYFVRWLGESAYPEPWLDWAGGEISSKWPDTALFKKMLRIARALNARVRDDDDTTYVDETAWQFDPNSSREQPLTSRPWWKRFFGGDA